MRFDLCIFILLCVYSVISENGDKENEEEMHRKRILEQLTKTRTVLLDDYHLVTRQTATDVYMFRSYRTVSVIFYPVMRDVSDARFTFQSEELHLNNIGACEPQDVIINLKHGSYPAVNPDGYDFPKNFIDPGTREQIHTLELLSDGRNRTYSVENPRPGNWYALAYIKWEDPRTQRVEQQGLAPACQTILYTDLQVKRDENIILIDCTSGLSVDYSHLPGNFKCIAPDNIVPINLQVSISKAPENHLISVKIQALSLPTADNYIIYCYFDPSLSDVHMITFDPNPNTWHYISIGELKDNITKVATCESYYPRADEEGANQTIQELMRDDKGRFFTFDFGLPTSDIQDSTSLVNLTSDEVTSLRFKVNQFHDIGGTLTLEASLLMPLKYYMGYKRELKKGSLLAFTEDNQFIRVVICMGIGHASIPLENGHCRYNDHVKPALFVLNSTDSDSIYDKIIIPYPDSGVWYLTFRLFCDSVVCPCHTSDNGTKYYVDSNALDKDSEEDVNLTNATRPGETKCNVSVVLSISSSSCVAGRCLNRGSCLLNTFGGMVMSFCSCSSGFGAWDCSDDTRMDSRSYMLTSILLLTLSNLLFFFSIYVAIIRLYYTEAMMFTFTMVFSTFYHACDAPAQVAYCIARGNILQFGDFFSGLMSFWVTLLAMSIVTEGFRSFFQLLGAVMIVLLTTWNMHSLMAFILPVTIGVSIVFISWFVDYRRTKKFKFPRSYYTRYLPIGIVLVSIGLICYAFLQTEQNYKVVHSIWHMIIALSVVNLLPDIRRGDGLNPFLLGPNYSCSLPFGRFFRRNQTPLDNPN